MIAKGGHPLIDADAIATLRARLLPLATVITPNLPEAEALAGRPIRTIEQMRAAAPALLGLGAAGVLLKGGHMEGSALTDLLVTAEGVEEFTSTRIETRHTHGTGCTLASAIAAGLAQGMSLRDAVMRVRAYVRAAIAAAPGYGAGHGPLDHGITFDPARLPG
jgi:hydroxymethylpyrimidine/phosphomethylpyrimidine kinase